MKQLFVFLILSLMIYDATAQNYQAEIPAEYGYIVKLGQQVPDFEIVLPDGTSTNIKALRGKVVMLQFTASWCSVCRKEMPYIESEIWLKHKGNPNFALYGIDLKEPKEKVVDFQKQTKVTYPIALDPNGKIFEQFTVPDAGVTRNIIVDRNGKIIFMTRLYKVEEFEQLKKVIATELGLSN